LKTKFLIGYNIALMTERLYCRVGGCFIDLGGECALLHGLSYEANTGATSLDEFEDYVKRVEGWRKFCKNPDRVTDDVIEAARQTCRERLERPELPPGLPDPWS
jgi:hypothetical protein